MTSTTSFEHAPEKAGGIIDTESLKSDPSNGLDPSIELHRGLKARHITMIAMGGAIGKFHLFSWMFLIKRSKLQ